MKIIQIVMFDIVVAIILMRFYFKWVNSYLVIVRRGIGKRKKLILNSTVPTPALFVGIGKKNRKILQAKALLRGFIGGLLLLQDGTYQLKVRESVYRSLSSYFIRNKDNLAKTYEIAVTGSETSRSITEKLFIGNLSELSTSNTLIVITLTVASKI